MRTLLKQTNEFGGEHIIDRDKSIFNAIKSLSGNPFEWLSQSMADYLDIEYYMNHSGDKPISPMFEKLYEYVTLESERFKTLANVIVNKFKVKWNKVFSALVENDYEPLENYNMEEIETPNITRESTQNKKTKIETETIDAKTENAVYGFNSSDAVPNGESKSNGKVVESGDYEDNKDHIIATEIGTKKLSRHGNIGVTTSQQMLESEMKLRNNYNFVNMLFKDVDSVLTLLVY